MTYRSSKSQAAAPVLYLHHDQAGSTRLLTGFIGKTEATFTYGAYGELTGSTGTATTPLGYDGQLTSSDTGLIYLRARVYDPSEDRAFFLDEDGVQRSLPRAWTDAGDVDPFVALAAGRSAFRVEDLLVLVELLDGLCRAGDSEGPARVGFGDGFGTNVATGGSSVVRILTRAYGDAIRVADAGASW